jgi:two-component system sensor histidine kinase BaeS
MPEFAWLVGVGGGVLAGAGLGWLHLRRLRPWKWILEVVQQLAAGHYDYRWKGSVDREMAPVVVALNQLAATLQRSEESRKQWVADVSHELRTPLAVLRAELEALQDGVRPLDGQALELLHNQVMALTHLSDDLFQLARSDLGQMHYRMAALDPGHLLGEVCQHYQARYQKAGLELQLQPSPRSLSIWGDSDRLRQLFSNLLENSLRYTDSPGRLLIRWNAGPESLEICFEDTPPGVDESKCQKLFDRFYRVETSRSKKLGGAGLGLALCHNIAVAHNAKLLAQPADTGGLRISLSIPLFPQQV